MSFEPQQRSLQPVYSLLGVLLLSAIFVPIITLKYGYSAFYLAAGGLGLITLLATFGATWLITRPTRRREAPADLEKSTLAGLTLGLLWVIEIGINNVVAPPLPSRDTIDDTFWALIGIGILAVSVAAAYRSGRIKQGISAGTWSGVVSGAVACGTALALVVLGMSLLRSDPINLAEWASRGRDSTAPTIAHYLAWETVAGAFLHLVVLGLGMGFVLGVLGGLLGKAAKRWQRKPSAG